MDPAFSLPDRQRLRSIYAEEIQLRIMSIFAQLRAREPVTGEFFPAIVQVFSAEHAESQHLLGRELR